MSDINLKMTKAEAFVLKQYLDSRDSNAIEVLSAELELDDEKIFWFIESMSAKISHKLKERHNALKRFIFGLILPIVVCFSVQFVYIHYIDENAGYCRQDIVDGEKRFIGRCTQLLNQLVFDRERNLEENEIDNDSLRFSTGVQ